MRDSSMRIPHVSSCAAALAVIFTVVACDDTVVVRARDFSSDTVTEEMTKCQFNDECVIADVNCGCDGPGTAGYRAAVHRDFAVGVPQECGGLNYGDVICKSCGEWVRATCYFGTCELTLSSEESCADDPECGTPAYGELRAHMGPWPYDY